VVDVPINGDVLVAWLRHISHGVTSVSIAIASQFGQFEHYAALTWFRIECLSENQFTFWLLIRNMREQYGQLFLARSR
jgi:hypothetical protein